MALLDPPRSAESAATAVVGVVVVHHTGSSLGDTIEALKRQVYETAVVTVAGGEATARQAALRRQVGWAATVVEAIAELPSDITHVWLVHDDSIPRPDALSSLVDEGGRLRANVAGSKILRSGAPGVLESVGVSTDVFELPYRGLETIELDQGQYDVVRDVAFVSLASLLVDRELLTEVGLPDENMEPTTASIDFCQRARLAGARVIVVPSSEVMHDAVCSVRYRRWRFEAGRIRAMLKAYSPLTLLWVLPLHFVLSIAVAALQLLGGRLRLPGVLLAWAWNLVRLPNTIRARWASPKIENDGELFRYQVGGSVAVGNLWRSTVDRVRTVLDNQSVKTLSHWVEAGQETVRRPVVASLMAAVATVLVATRQAWTGYAAGGYLLLPPDSPAAALQAYAGGWNPAGLGSPEPLRPIVAVMALIQGVLFTNAHAAVAVVTAAAAVGGVTGMARLTAPWGLRPIARYSAGVIYVLGPATRWLAGEGNWPAFVALSAVPWVVGLVIHRRRWVGTVAAAGIGTALSAAFAPFALALPTVVTLVWLLLGAGDARWRPVAKAGLAAAAAFPLLMPWSATVDLEWLLDAGVAAYWRPSPWILLLGVAMVGGLLAGGREALATLGAFGGAVAVLGVLVARTGGLDWGTEVGAAGAMGAAFGFAIVVGSAIELAYSAVGVHAWGAVARRVAPVAAVLTLAGIATMLLTGRTGFPNRDLSERLAFTAELGAGAHRVLMFGEDLPGHPRTVAGIQYRVLSTPDPRLWELWLGEPRSGDLLLDSAVADLAAGESFRVGERLAGFGVRWILAPSGSRIADALDSQLDMRPLGLADESGYESELAAFRAVDNTGQPWRWEYGLYRGPRATRSVFIAENADTRWGAEWEQADWANLVTESQGAIRFGPVPALRAAAWRAAALVVFYLVVAGWARDKW